MEELNEIKQMIEVFKETLTFLVEQEKIRGEEVSALNDKIEAVNKTLFDNIINPSIEAYQEEQFNGFKDKYGEKLEQFDETIRTSMNDPEYDSTREAWNKLQEMPEEEREGVDTDAYVDSVANGLSEYVDNIKKSLGLSEDTPVEITEDENGEIEVKADTNGDGEVDEVVAQEGETEAPASEEEKPETEDEDEVDPELLKQLDEWANK